MNPSVHNKNAWMYVIQPELGVFSEFLNECLFCAYHDFVFGSISNQPAPYHPTGVRVPVDMGGGYVIIPMVSLYRGAPYTSVFL